MDYRTLRNAIRSVFMTFTGYTDYHHLPHPRCTEIDLDLPEQYYIDLSAKINYDGKFDQKGVFLLYWDKKHGWVYHPIAIFNYAIAAYQEYRRTKDPKLLDTLLCQLTWACEFQEREGSRQGSWSFDFPFPTFGLKPGWISGMAQGLAISVLVRTARLLNKEQYNRVAERALLPFLKRVSDGGVATCFDDKIDFFEEYPSTPSSLVLNGFITSALGLRDLYVFQNNTTAEELWRSCVASLEQLIPHYDLGYWSRYDLRENGINVASRFYHKYHIDQLLIMQQITGKKIFLEYAEKFDEYQHQFLSRQKAFVNKVRWRLKNF